MSYSRCASAQCPALCGLQRLSYSVNSQQHDQGVGLNTSALSACLGSCSAHQPAAWLIVYTADSCDKDARTDSHVYRLVSGSRVELKRLRYTPNSLVIHAAHSVPRAISMPISSLPRISVTFIDRDGTEFNVQASVGEDMLSVAHRKDIDLEGACEGSLACSTCHVVIDEQEMFDKIPEADDDENDMLDLAFGLTETSRLGCQVIAQPELDGMVMRIPDATRNFAVDGHRPKPH